MTSLASSLKTTRFKAAVTGAGAVEHVGNWGNDDNHLRRCLLPRRTPLGSPSALSRRSRHLPNRQSPALPTHIVAGANDIRVAVSKIICSSTPSYSLGVPNKLLIFPGEGHSLSKNPWHGKIKVREELQWAPKYARQ